jgi:hypothetical protein
MHRLENNILHHAKKQREKRNLLKKFKQEKQNGVIKRTYLNKNKSINKIIYI